MHKQLLTFGILIFCGLQWVMTSNSKVVEEIEAVDDFTSTFPGQPVSINVLENDKGEGLRLTQIVESPQCGEILAVQEDGLVVYVADADTECTVDVFKYEVEDNSGEKDTATISIFIEQFSELIVQVERDCYNPDPENCFYCRNVYIAIAGGVPPFVVSGIIDTTLYDVGIIGSIPICVYEPYDIYVRDSTGAEFYEGYSGEIFCTHYRGCFPSWQPYELQCNGDGTATVLFDESGKIEEAYWTAPDGHKKELKDGDVVLNKSYLQFFQRCGGQSDTLVNCFSASDDYLVVGLGRSRWLNVLENDFGENNYVSKILTEPACGELESWSSSGYFKYGLWGNASCEMDRLTYIVSNDLGQKDTATIWIEVEQEPTLILNWEVECDTEAQGIVSITIENGIPPYYITGYINDETDENYYFFLVPQNVDEYVEISDSDSHSAKFVPTYWGECIGECYELDENEYWADYIIECNQDGTANIVGSFIDNAENMPTRKSFWIDADGTYHPLDFAEIKNITFPNHSYFYVETKQSGHIDGFINCPTIDIEAVDDIASTFTGDSLIINILENDVGDGLRLTQIVESPQCGEILEWSEFGEVHYFIEEGEKWAADSLKYEVVDNWGNRDTAIVTILISPPPPLIVQIEGDCTSPNTENCYYCRSLAILIQGGTPPYVVSGAIDTVLNQPTAIYIPQTCRYDLYEIAVVDSEGTEFLEIVEGGYFCTHYTGCYPNWKPYELQCNGDGTATVRIDESGEVEEAYWTAPDGHKKELKDGDVVLDRSYLQFFQMCGGQSDTLVNCFSASDDYFVVGLGRSRWLNISENDFGENIEVSEILTMPVCGDSDIEVWGSESYIYYNSDENTSCEKDSLVYVISNDLGQKDTATVRIEVQQEPEILLNWEIKCKDNNFYEGEMYVVIENGTPPYSVFGIYNDNQLEVNHFSFIVSIYDDVELEVMDAEGNQSSIDTQWYGGCSSRCYEVDHNFYWDYTIDCNGDGTANIEGLELGEYDARKSFWIDADGTYHSLNFAEIGNFNFPNHSYFYIETRQRLGHIDGFINCPTATIEAAEDFGETNPGHAAIINVLENDIGDGLRLTQIVESPQCGEILEWSEFGEVVYVADADTECTVDLFVYEVEDSWGNKDTARAVIMIEQLSELIVWVEKNCSGTYETGNYSLEVFVYGEAPPFTIDMNGQKDTLYEQGMIAYEILETGDFQNYELSVRDSTEHEFYDTHSMTPCVYFNWFCEDGGSYKPKISCLGGGNVRVEIVESVVGKAHWIDAGGMEHSLKQIDTIPDLSYLFISPLGGIGFDTLVNCLAANDDFYKTITNSSFSFNVLENDFGQEIQVSRIVEMPECGELLEWSADGEMRYQADENEECLENGFVYEIENDLGEKATARVEFGEDLNEDMYLEWGLECFDWEACLLEATIQGGVPPYSIEGNFNDVLEENHFSAFIGCGENFEITITDSDGQVTSLNVTTTHDCDIDYDCYQPKFIHQYLEIDCLGELGGVVDYLVRMNMNLLEKAFYIDSQNQYHELKDQDTIPNNSYYYLKIKQLGHIDGYINCLTTDIEEETSLSSNSSLQLYPNPNRGEFSLQLQTSKSSLQSFPIQVYNIAGQSIWKGTIQSNRLETLDLGNVGSGLYVLQVVMGSEVLVERFWVE